MKEACEAGSIEEAVKGGDGKRPTVCEGCGSVVGGDGCCLECGVGHNGPPCAKCGRWGYHAGNCPEMEGSEEPEVNPMLEPERKWTADQLEVWRDAQKT